MRAAHNLVEDYERGTSEQRKQQALHGFIQSPRRTEVEDRMGMLRAACPPPYYHDPDDEPHSLINPVEGNRPPPYQRVDSRPDTQSSSGLLCYVDAST